MSRTAKLAVATIAAVLTLSTAVAAAVVLPSGGGDSEPAAMHTSGQSALLVDPANPATAATETSVQAGGDVSLPTSPASTSAVTGAQAGANVTTPSIPTPSIPVPTVPTSLPVPGGVVPDVSQLTGIPAQVMDCLAPIFDLIPSPGSMPSIPNMSQLMQLGPTIVNCVTAIVATLPLPFGLNGCISEIMGFVNTMMSQMGSGIPNIGNLNVAACIPSGLPVPTGPPGFTGSGFPFRL